MGLPESRLVSDWRLHPFIEVKAIEFVPVVISGIWIAVVHRAWCPRYATALASSTWPWLLGLQGPSAAQPTVAVRAGVIDTLMGRVLPLLGEECRCGGNR